MAKFNIEVELDWMDEEAYSIDDELRERIVKGVEDALLKKATDEAVKAVDNKIAEKILEAEETIQATVDQFIANVCEEKIGKIVIPQKKSSWSEGIRGIFENNQPLEKGLSGVCRGSGRRKRVCRRRSRIESV